MADFLTIFFFQKIVHSENLSISHVISPFVQSSFEELGCFVFQFNKNNKNYQFIPFTIVHLTQLLARFKKCQDQSTWKVSLEGTTRFTLLASESSVNESRKQRIRCFALRHILVCRYSYLATMTGIYLGFYRK